MFIQENKTRTLWGVTLGLSAGILLGGSVASWENRACTQAGEPAAYCFAATPKVRVVQGMVRGAFASGGAVLMIHVWGRSQNAD